MGKLIVKFFLAVICVFLLSPAKASQQAVWQEKHVKFWFASFDTYYNCDALEAKLQDLLTVLGAKGDMRVRASGCVGMNDVERSISVKMQFSVPSIQTQPSSEQLSKGASFLVDYQTLEVTPNKPRSLDRGECELIEHFVRYVLPAFDYEMLIPPRRCVKGSTHFYSHYLTLKVLLPTQQD